METITKYKIQNGKQNIFCRRKLSHWRTKTKVRCRFIIQYIRRLSVKEAIVALEKSKRVLNKGGVILVADQFCQTMNSSFSKANLLLIVLELINSSSGVPYSSKEVTTMLKNAGFSQIKEAATTNTGGVSVISAKTN